MVCCLEILTLLFANFLQGGKPKIRPEELFPYLRLTLRPQTPEAMERQLIAWAKGLQRKERRTARKKVT